jgi:hypothetical protein
MGTHVYLSLRYLYQGYEPSLKYRYNILMIVFVYVLGILFRTGCAPMGYCRVDSSQCPSF